MKESFGEKVGKVRDTLSRGAYNLFNPKEQLPPGFTPKSARELEVATSRAKVEELIDLSGKDPLTGLANRREFDSRLEELKERWKPKSPELGGKRSVDLKHLTDSIDKRRQNDFVVIMIDLDNFKVINDTLGLGHAAGDAVLHQVGELLLSNKILRAHDIPARYGGEEIVVICPETRLDEGDVVAEKIRKGIANLNPIYNDNVINITASLGVSSAATTLDIDKIVKEADAAMYQAKSDGRNLVRAAIPSRHDLHTATSFNR